MDSSIAVVSTPVGGSIAKVSETIKLLDTVGDVGEAVGNVLYTVFHQLVWSAVVYTVQSSGSCSELEHGTHPPLTRPPPFITVGRIKYIYIYRI